LNVWFSRILKLYGVSVSSSDTFRMFLTNSANEVPRGLEITSEEDRTKDKDSNTKPAIKTSRNSKGADDSANPFEACIIRDDGSEKPCIIHMGIIDILTEYTTTKKLETMIKGSVAPRSTLSSVDSAEYCERFIKFISNALV
jgi:hypothetical protein